ncbi:ATP-binding protein [Jeotgalibaca arthritidis]|uniref:ATP-binding protein n=1 Tax=Jeotgalibaca arthritidis TaxID=1868794 RepID=A0A6G7KBI2_9LACT|nr:ATP-binding protein [Jeotgalibaca arthritidis]QII82616.1 ATP-binding protein [Jeotgalibaca arthritidis]
MINTSKLMSSRSAFIDTAINKGGLLPLEEYSTCEKHINVELFQNLKTKEIICPVCYLEKQSDQTAATDSQVQDGAFGDRARKFRYLANHSLFQNKNLMNKGFKDYKATTKEQKENRDAASSTVSRIVGGQPLNIIITGSQGSGKTHLATAIGNNVNAMSNRDDIQKTVLYYSFSRLLNVIRDSYSNPTFKGEKYYLELAEKADLLILDDIGVEMGGTATGKKSEFSNKILFSLLDTREDKATIITSNLNLESLEKQYDPRIISRLKANMVPITFTETADYREKMMI